MSLFRLFSWAPAVTIERKPCHWPAVYYLFLDQCRPEPTFLKLFNRCQDGDIGLSATETNHFADFFDVSPKRAKRRIWGTFRTEILRSPSFRIKCVI